MASPMSHKIAGHAPSPAIPIHVDMGMYPHVHPSFTGPYIAGPMRVEFKHCMFAFLRKPDGTAGKKISISFSRGKGAIIGSRFLANLHALPKHIDTSAEAIRTVTHTPTTPRFYHERDAEGKVIIEGPRVFNLSGLRTLDLIMRAQEGLVRVRLHATVMQAPDSVEFNIGNIDIWIGLDSSPEAVEMGHSRWESFLVPNLSGTGPKYKYSIKKHDGGSISLLSS